MRIARVLTRLNLGGPARQVLASDPRLAQRGFQVRVFAGRPEAGEGDLFDTARQRGIDVVRVPGLERSPSPRAALAAYRFLRRGLREFRPDIVHTHASMAGALGRLAAQGLGVPRVHTFHGHVLEGLFSPAVSSGIVLAERALGRLTDQFIAVSQATAEVLVRRGFAPHERIAIVPPGVELDALLSMCAHAGALRERLGVPEDTLLVGVVGRLAPVKRPAWALDVLQALAAAHPRLQLVFVGDGGQRALIEARLAAGPAALRSRVHLLGPVRDMAPVLRDLDAVLLASRSEGLPVALIEAAAAGLPAVATRVGGTAEIVDDGRTGFLGDTADELAAALDRLLADPGLRRRLGENARASIGTRFGAERLATQLSELYTSVAERTAPVRGSSGPGSSDTGSSGPGSSGPGSSGPGSSGPGSRAREAHCSLETR